MKIGILYLLTFPNGKRYVGITSTSLRRRLVVHFHHARKGRQGALQSAIRKYGATFQVKKLVVAEWSFLLDLEKKAIASFRTKSPDGYNLTDGGEGTVGRKMTDAERESVRQRNLRRMASGKFYLSPPNGYKHSAETRAKMSKSRNGHIVSEDTRRKIGKTKIGNVYNVGRSCPPEVRKKISSSQKGKPRFTDEQKRHLSEIRRGKPWSDARRRAYEETRNGAHPVT